MTNCFHTITKSGRIQEAEETRDLIGFSTHNERKGFIMPERKSIRERFESKYKVDESAGCWLWTGSKDKDGYGKIYANSKHSRGHRVSYELHVGPVPEGVCVLHRCDTPSCVNPDCLFLGTIDDNNKDKAAKGRAARNFGESGCSNLTEADVRLIKQFLLRCSVLGAGEFLSRWFGVAQSTISMIKHKSNWSHVV